MRPVTAVLILAAGASRRLGRPKQMEQLGGETLLERAVRVATEAESGTVYVAVGAAADTVVAEARRLRCVVVLNEEAEEGMAASIRAGVRALGGTEAGLVVMTCDQPAVTSAHLRLLPATSPEEVVASVYEDRRGVPAYFPRSAMDELLKLKGDAGARELLKDARAIPLANGELDLDTEEDFAQARRIFGG